MDKGNRVVVFSVPSDSEQGNILLPFIEDVALLQVPIKESKREEKKWIVPRVKLPGTAVGRDSPENEGVVREANVVNFSVVSNQLRELFPFFDVPNGACRVDAGSSNDIWVFNIPVETRQRGRILHVVLLLNTNGSHSRDFGKFTSSRETSCLISRFSEIS